MINIWRNKYVFEEKHTFIPMPAGYKLTKNEDDSFKLEYPKEAYDLATDAEKRGK